MARDRRFTDPRQAAEAAFKAATSSKPVAEPPEEPRRPAIVPGAREMVTLRLDRAVLEHFQKDGPGWQDRVNDALKGLIAT